MMQTHRRILIQSLVALVLGISVSSSTPITGQPVLMRAQFAKPITVHTQPWYLDRIGAPHSRIVPYPSIIVAVIDDGIDAGAPQLDGQIIGIVNIVAPDQLRDESGHGTHTAGIIAARPGSSGIRGICDACQLLIIKAITNTGYGSDLTVARAITIAIERGARVINLSIGGTADTPAIRRAVADAIAHDIVVVAAAGNVTSTGPHRYYPAAYPEVIAVSAIDHENRKASFATTDRAIDLVAPGVDIANIDTSADGIGVTQGTSTAAPQVSAAAALLRARYPMVSAMGIRRALLSASIDLGPPGRDDTFGYGLLNIPRAFAVLQRSTTRANQR